MQREVFVVEKERFDLSDEKIYHLQGTWPKEHTAAAELDGKSLEVNLKQQERISALCEREREKRGLVFNSGKTADQKTGYASVFH